MEINPEERARRVRQVAMVLPAIVGFFTVAFVDRFAIEYDFYPFKPQLLSLIGYVFVAFSALVVLMTYLQMGVKGFLGRDPVEKERYRDQSIESLEHDLASAKNDIARALAKVEAQANAQITKEDREKIAVQLRTSIATEANEKAFGEFKAYAIKEIETSIKHRDVREMLKDSRSRLQQELAALGFRGNLNLAFGAITTIVGLTILGTSVYSEVVTNKDILSFASHFIPRFTLVIFIEIFAYFFLSLYRASLQEIKYFQNELTNVESKQAALVAALNFEDQVALNKVLTALAETERNHILSKDQTTVELEKAKAERASNSDMLKLITELFQKKSG